MEDRVHKCNKSRWLPLVPILTYLLLAAQYLDRPGQYYDELFWLNAAVGMPVEGLFCTLQIRSVPIMVMGYIGALKSWVYAIPLAIFGTSTVAIRSVSLALGCCVLLLLWKYLRRYFSPTWAALITAAVAMDPAFIYCTRCDWGPVTLMLLCKLLTLLAFTAYLTSAKSYYLYLCGVGMILGIYDKANFSWFFVAFFISAVLVYGNTLLKYIKAEPKKTITAYFFLGLVMLAIGMIYLVPMALSGGAFSFRLPYVLNILHSTLDGSGVYSFFFSASIHQRTWLYPAFLIEIVICPCISLLSLYLHKQEKMAKFGLFHTLCTILLIFCMACTKEFGGAHHIMMIYPAPELLLGCCCVLFAGILPKRKMRVANILGRSLFTLLALTCLFSTFNYLRILQRNDTYRPTWDPQIVTLGKTANSYNYDYLITADWGFANQMIVEKSRTVQNVNTQNLWFMRPDLWRPDDTWPAAGLRG